MKKPSPPPRALPACRSTGAPSGCACCHRFGLGLMLGLWAWCRSPPRAIPSPADTFKQALEVFSDPFYSKGPNDQGVGWNVLFSSARGHGLRPGGAGGHSAGF
jgi:nitrate/nitrite transport system permease protein